MEANKSKYQINKEKQLLKEIELETKKRNELIAEIQKHGNFTELDLELIIRINELVMSVDGTAEGWGGYNYNPVDYVYESIEIFNLTKKYFQNV